MIHRALGATGVEVPALAFGAGPVPAVMTGDDAVGQRRLIESALAAGIDWFDTAAGYGNGASERALGRALADLGATNAVHIATKVRLRPELPDSLACQVRRSVEESLDRLGVERVTLVQVHNAITNRRGDELYSLAPSDLWDAGGALEGLEAVRRAGKVRLIGLTGTGNADALKTVIDTGAFDTVQTPFNILNPSAGRVLWTGGIANYGDILTRAARRGMGTFAIRVFGGGALTGSPPSEHTQRTPFFPLDLYSRDQERAGALEQVLRPHRLTVKEAALRFVMSQPAVSSAIIGFADPVHVAEAVHALDLGPLSESILALLSQWQSSQAARR